MKNLRYLLIVLLVLPSCQYFKNKFQTKHSSQKIRTVAQAPTEGSRYHDVENINIFNSLMSNPMDKIGENGKLEQVFIKKVRAHVERHFDFLYTGQEFMHDFDKELDRLVKIKRKNGGLDASETQKINLIYFQLQVARTIYERNLHELADLYLLTLETRMATDINDDANLKTKTTLVLSQLPGWLDEAWNKRFKIGAMAIAEIVDDVNQEFIRTTPAASRYTIDVERFVKISNQARNEAYKESKSADVLKHFQDLSRFVEKSARKQIEQELSELEKNPERLMTPFFEEKRQTQAALDDLYPSADGHGHISGKLVPANTWAMTLDDGPHPTYTPGMIKVFNDNKVPVTFFWLSKNINLYPNLIAQARGNFKSTGNHFYVASHSMTHANLPTLNEKQLEVEITDAATMFEKIVGERPTLFRCPYGACGPMGSPIRQIIAKNNMIHVHWNVDPLDWQDTNPQSIVERTQKQIELRGKGIVLFHDVHPQSVEALKILVPYMKNKKYRMISMPQMITEIREKDFYSP